MGFFDKLFGSEKKPEQGQMKISASGMPYIEGPAKKGPWSVEDHINESVNLFVMGEHKRALEHANKAVSLDPNNGDAYSVRAAARKQLGDKVGAEADELKAEELSPQKSEDEDDYY